MSWIRDDAEDLVNLDHMRSIAVHPLAEEQKEEFAPHTHVVVAMAPDEASYWLFTGELDECVKRRDLIATKLPLVRF